MNKILKDIPSTVLSIANTLTNQGYNAYLVGGAVRDMLMGIKPNEYDITTNARPKDVQRIFKHTIPIGIKHGTILVIVNDMPVEITTFRSDGDYTDGRHPDNVIYADTIEEDLPRRDLTINAMAYDMSSNTLIDMFDGIEDIKNKKIRAVGNPYERFKEDGLRLMRAIRFATKLDFEIEASTLKAIFETKDMLKLIAYERIREEFNKILLSENVYNGFELMREAGILDIILPELMLGYGVDQNKFHKYDVYYHILNTVKNVEKLENDDMTLIVKLAGLFHDIAKPIVQKNIDKQEAAVYYNHEVVGSSVAKKVMRRFKYANSQIDMVSLLVRQHMFYYQDEWTDGAVRRFMCSIGLENIKPLLKLREADRIGSGKRKDKESAAIPKLLKRIDKIIEAENAITVKALNINGDDLIKEFAIKPSPLIGRILHHLLDIILEEPHLNEYDILLEKSKEYMNSIT